MESVLGRYRNLIVLVAVLFAQVLGLAVQVKRTTDSEPTRLIRIWAVGAVTPLEKALLWIETSTSNLWHNYLYLRGVRAENRQLKQEIEQMRLEQARMSQDADQARRLQALLSFKEQFISQTMAAQVIGSSGSEQARTVYIDKGARDGIRPDMAVITKDGIVGKVLQVFGSNPLEASTSQVLLINDQSSGVGAILDKSRLQGILRGTPSGEVVLEKVMSDETVPVGELLLTSGGDGIFPKGLAVGRVTKVSPGSELFLNIRVRPAADLSRLEEVLVVTKIDERQAQPVVTGPQRAIDILAARLPSVPVKQQTVPGVASKTPAAPDGGTNPALPSAQNGAKPTSAPTGTSVAGAPTAVLPNGHAPSSTATESVMPHAPAPIPESPNPTAVVKQPATSNSPSTTNPVTGSAPSLPAAPTPVPARPVTKPADSPDTSSPTAKQDTPQ